jgi:glycosyltransferase involved in cell wall biosynthesis
LKKLAIITSHPIQYNAPLFQLLAKDSNLNLMVFYTSGEASIGKIYDPEFGKLIDWNIPLLEGYNFRFIKNISKSPGSHHFFGIINPSLNSEVETWGADIVWIWGWSFYSHLSALKYFKGKMPVWFRGDSTLLNEHKAFSFKKICRRFFLRWVYKSVDKAFYVGSNNKHYFLKHGIKNEQLIYLPHVIDNNRFSNNRNIEIDRIINFKSSLGFNSNEIVLLYAGKFDRIKNVDFLIESVKNLKVNNVKLLLVGNGILESELKQKAIEMKNIIFLDFQDQSVMPILYRVADLFILPSLQDTWGLSVNESLACGTPVVVSNKCGCAIDLVDFKNGIIIDVNDKYTSFEKISNFIENIKNINKSEIQDNYVKKFDINKFVSKVIDEL